MSGHAGDPGRATFARRHTAWTRQGQRILIATLLALVLSSLLVLADATGAIPSTLLPHTPLHAPHAHGFGAAESQSTIAPTATTAPQPVPVITLVSPSSGQGPVGAHVTISGKNFSGSTASIFASTAADCSAPQGTLVSPTLSGGSFSATAFIWPTNLSSGTYSICANGMTGNAPAYQVTAVSPPALSLSAASAAAGESITVTGSNFVGYPAGTTISITESAGGPLRTLNPATLGPDGAFSVTETLDKTIVGNNVAIAAYSPSESAGVQSVLQASASLNVQLVTPTPTLAATPTATSSGTIGSPSGGKTPRSNNTGIIVLLIVGIVLALLVILGVVAFLMLRGKPGDGPGTQGSGYPGEGGGYGGYGGTVSGPQYGQEAGRPYATGSQFGRSGVHNAPTPYSNPQLGGVSQWDEPQSSPGPDWQPRPMTGYGTGDQSQYGTYGDQPDYPTYPSTVPQQPAHGDAYPPADPWGQPTDRAGYPPQQGFSPDPSYGTNVGRTQPAEPAHGQGLRPENAAWDNQSNDNGWGDGATRPGVPHSVRRDTSSHNEPGW